MTNQAYVSQCCGAVKGWTFSLDRRSLANPVELYVWRPVEGRNFSRLWLVGKHHFYADAASYYSDEEDDDDDDEYEYEDSGGSRERSVFVPEGHRISIIPGDVIGWRSPEGDVISYTSRYYNPDNVIVNRMEEMEVGTAHVFPAPVTSHRTYGINAVLTSSAAPVIINLPARVNMYADVTKGSAVFNVTGYDENIGDVVMYLLPNNEDDDKANDLPFDIEPISDGSLAVTRSLMSEPVTSYSIEVFVNDSVVTAGPSMLHIILTDINHAPVFTNVPPLVLMEENSSGVVLVLSVSDADGDAITFVSVEWIPEQATTYLLFNETASDGYKTSSVNVTLVVTDVNEPPECFQAFFYVIVDEGTVS
ncbi:protocadherin-15-like [Littorina saxatilis]|uniref:protocadherin-15-like n=1 Tax=Littorina saxatilis TaxID=31220 RepID=UPI0038B42B4C